MTTTSSSASPTATSSVGWFGRSRPTPTRSTRKAAIRAVDKRAKVDDGEYLGLLSDAGLDRATAQEFDDLISDVETVDDLDAVAEAGGEDVEAAVENLRNVLAAADDFGAGAFCEVSLTTARGLDYYTGVVFECFDSTGEVSRSVFGGGRYDDLIESFGGQPTPRSGSRPVTPPLVALCRAGVWPDEELTTDYYVLSVGVGHALGGDRARTRSPRARRRRRGRRTGRLRPVVRRAARLRRLDQRGDGGRRR